MIWIKSRSVVFMAGILSGAALMVIIAAWADFHVPSWLVVEDKAQQAEVAVVLGGGGGSRLRKGLALYDAGVVKQLLLVDRKKGDWMHIVDHLCPECEIEGKDVVFLEESVNTFSDATLVANYCSEQGVNNILVVTDPYHSRRAQLIFDAEFEGTGVVVSVVHSGDYVGKLSPQEKWWRDDRTVRVMWDEIGKILFLLTAGGSKQ